jgi:uncharacterized membrane protein YcaP (DUF421 family)
MVVAFRGHLVEGLMKKHRITEIDLYGSLRSAGIFNICEIEAVVLGTFSSTLIKQSVANSIQSQQVYSPYIAQRICLQTM